ncbi:unnamed protein product, partial [Rotaria sp. Silwood2]
KLNKLSVIFTGQSMMSINQIEYDTCENIYHIVNKTMEILSEEIVEDILKCSIEIKCIYDDECKSKIMYE